MAEFSTLRIDTDARGVATITMDRPEVRNAFDATLIAEMHREVLAGRDRKILTVGEMPGVTIEEARLFTDPARSEVDMVFTFEHMGVDHAHTKWDLVPFRLAALKTVLGRWQEGLAENGWNSLYWNNHDQPRAVSRFGDDCEHRTRSAKRSWCAVPVRA